MLGFTPPTKRERIEAILEKIPDDVGRLPETIEDSEERTCNATEVCRPAETVRRPIQDGT